MDIPKTIFFCTDTTSVGVGRIGDELGSVSDIAGKHVAA